MTLRVARGVDALDRSVGRLALTVGVFDGLHRGHQSVLRHLVRQARKWDARPAVVTFDAHPDEVLRGSAPPLLLDPDERLARLAAADMEVVVIEHFDDRLRRTPYDVWVAGITARIDLAGFVMTPESAFGHERRGTPAAVRGLGASKGFDVAIAPTFTVDGRPVSSSAIRSAIGAGELDAAARLLGRRHAVVGELIGEPSDEGSDAHASNGPLAEAAEAAGASAGARMMKFPMPVALPPAGTYRASVERFDGLRPADRGRPAVVIVSDEGVVVADNRAQLSRSRRIRVAFVEKGV